MEKIINGDKKSRDVWMSALKERLETGEPYMHFLDNTNKTNPECYKDKGLGVEMTNICSEIMLHTDEDHSFVCCLSSLNLARWDEWKDTDLIETSIYFLDGVMEEFIDKAKKIPGFERAVRFAEKSRALGLGVLGWHTLLQSKMLPMDCFEAMMLNGEIFRTLKQRSDTATKQLAKEYGEPEWCKGHGIRNTHLIAVAPTASNSVISGGVSAGIEPIISNAYAHKTAKGVFIIKNKQLETLLESKKQNTTEIWKKIVSDDGSVQNLDFLSVSEKEVFATAYEINQMTLIRQAGQRQKFIDQGQSLNLFFSTNCSPKWFHEVHLEAWKAGIKTLYYCRSTSVLKGDSASRQVDECKTCHA